MFVIYPLILLIFRERNFSLRKEKMMGKHHIGNSGAGIRTMFKNSFRTSAVALAIFMFLSVVFAALPAAFADGFYSPDYDFNSDGSLNISDVTELLNILANSSSSDPDAIARYDANKDGSLNISDVTELLNILSGSVPESPYAITLDGLTDDWSAEQKANALKGWYEDSEGRMRGLEYMAFIDDEYVYLYTRTITASNADKGLDIIFNKDQDRLATGLWFEAPGENVVDYYFAPNVALENGLYETVSEIVLNKAPFVNKNGNVYLGVWFIGCDDGFAPLSWHEDGKTTIWGLNHRCPWNVAMSHQKVTENGFDHYHYLDENGVCGWCQERITFPITIDGDCSDWNPDILNTAKTSDNGKHMIYAAAYTDDEYLYIYLELTQHVNAIPNYINIFCKNSQTDGIRTTESFALFYDDWNPLRPWCQGSWACAYYADCDDGYTARAMRKTTDADGNPVTCLELVIDKELASDVNGTVLIEVQIDDIATWSSGQALSGWALIPVTENGFGN